MIHFDERRHHHSTRWPADEEPIWRKGWTTSSGKPKKGNRKKDSSSGKTSTAIVPKTLRIDVIPQYKSGPYRNVYWMHPNMAITRESREKEEFVGEVVFYQGVNTNVIVNFFPGLDYSPNTDYLQKNMETLLKKLDILAFKQAIIDSRPPDN